MNLIPPIYFKVLNILGTKECPACRQWLTWYHLPIHGFVIRNPSLVIPYKLNQWEQTKTMEKNLQKATRYQLQQEKQQWTAQLDLLYLSLKNLINVPGAQSP